MRFCLSLLIFGFLLQAQAAAGATLALVGEESGHAILVQHRGQCYAVLPDHVAATGRFPLVSALPQTTGVGTVFHRKPDIDLALAFVEGDLAQSCELEWSALAQDLSDVIRKEASGGLTRIQFGGQFIDRAEATIVDADDTHFVIVTSERWASSEVMAGVSGAAFYFNGTPLGLALTSLDTNRARFLRMDRVYQELSRVLVTNQAFHPTLQDIAGAQEGISYRVTSQVRVLNGVRRGVEDAFDASWDGAQLEIVFTLSQDLPIRLNKIMLETQPQDAITYPQRLSLELDRGSSGQPRWYDIFAPDMPPNGMLEVPTGGTTARRVRLTIRSVWHPGRPVRLENVIFE